MGSTVRAEICTMQESDSSMLLTTAERLSGTLAIAPISSECMAITLCMNASPSRSSSESCAAELMKHFVVNLKVKKVSETNRNTSIADTSNGAPVKQQLSCQPKTHIMFLKTHKTASSTILNILYRFGEARNLTFALPRHKGFQFGYPKQFSAAEVEDFPGASMQYDIMCNHLRFYLPQVEMVMPNDTFYFSIIRNPTAMVESTFTYYKLSVPAFLHAETLSEFAKYPWRYYEASRTNNHYARNLLWFDFGFNNNGNYSKGNESFVVNKIERTFNLILITEYFDESMILLKEALCWELDDVVSFKLNFRSNDTKQHMADETIENIKEWNTLDWALYRHFNRTFWRKIDETIGKERMQQEVEALRQMRTGLMKVCLHSDGAVDPSMVNDTAIKPFQFGIARILGYNLNPQLNNNNKVQCLRIITPELQYTTMLHNKQFRHRHNARTPLKLKTGAPKPTDMSELMGQDLTMTINLKRTQAEKLFNQWKHWEGSPEQKVKHSDSAKDQSQHMDNPMDQRPHVDNPKDQGPHMDSPEVQGPHMDNPKDQSPHMNNPKDQCSHMNNPKDQGSHMDNPKD
uniref:galactose-3-O-sulfotransferase 2-like n=1 Tax=Pristiophorus japonicus TaxID=55135 RepID=UPI00398E976A